MNNFSDYSGNRANLRAKAIHQIKRIEAISNTLGSLGDFLVTTWGGIFFSLGILGLGAIIIFLTLYNASFVIILENILPAILMLIGVILLALNAVLTNPVQGSQLVVSIKFIANKLKNIKSSKQRIKFRPFRFLPGDDKQSVVQQLFLDGHTLKYRYIVAYNVRGIVSPVTFDADLEASASADADLLMNNERDTVLSTAVTIDKTTVRKKRVPRNATPAMIAKRNLQYNLTHDLPNNQQIKTMVVISAPTIELLRQRMQHLESSYHRGLVVGYKRLVGKELKDRFNGIFGEGSI